MNIQEEYQEENTIPSVCKYALIKKDKEKFKSMYPGGYYENIHYIFTNGHKEVVSSIEKRDIRNIFDSDHIDDAYKEVID